jgi:hypothetical protein
LSGRIVHLEGRSDVERRTGLEEKKGKVAEILFIGGGGGDIGWHVDKRISVGYVKGKVAVEDYPIKPDYDPGRIEEPSGGGGCGRRRRIGKGKGLCGYSEAPIDRGSYRPGDLRGIGECDSKRADTENKPGICIIGDSVNGVGSNGEIPTIEFGEGIVDARKITCGTFSLSVNRIICGEK